MKLPDTAHFARPWRIHEIAGDFRLEDVWALPTPGGPQDFPLLIEMVSSFDEARERASVVGVLFAIREALGRVLGWDDTRADPNRPSLLQTLPVDLRACPSAVRPALGFTPLYQLADEWAAEVVNQTVHGVVHLGWVPDGSGGYRGQMAVLVKPNGLLGRAYMAAITPFRYLIVYPRMLKAIGEKWLSRTGRRTPPASSAG
ncbi:DUF2867 domain-containing protein [Mycolicibacterium moriokaense]|nr:DUF2867 domain-containing protein [Mycolicibacterium moriokaense]